MYTKLLRHFIKNIKGIGNGHCVPDNGGSTGHCY
jgi:hypothetical protein